MEDELEKWLLQGVLTVVFAWMVYRLVNIFTDFFGQDMKLVRNVSEKEESSEILVDGATMSETLVGVSESLIRDLNCDLHVVGHGQGDSLPAEASSDKIADVAKVESTNQYSDDEEWEGVETSELEDAFNGAATLVASNAVGHGSQLSNELQLELYGLYKQATEGRCNTTQPSVFQLRAKAKWESWKNLGDMKEEEAMENYIALTQSTFGIMACDHKNTEDNRNGNSTEGESRMGPVFSSPIVEEEVEDGSNSPQGIHAFSRDGDHEKLQRLIVGGSNVNETDEEGRTAVHWAVDRGHLELLQLLAESGANLQAVDSEGQTPLHYAVVCQHEDIAKELLKRGSNPVAPDNEGVTPLSMAPKSWEWMH